MKRLIIVAVLLGMLATVSKCIASELLNNQIEYIVNDRLDRFRYATNKWDKYEYVCLELYARILIDLDFQQAFNENEGDIERANLYALAYDDIAEIFSTNGCVYDAMLYILTYLDLYVADYALDVLTETDEYSSYMKWDYSVWFGCIRKLKCSQDEQAWNINHIQDTMEQYHTAIENADNPDDMGEIVEVYLNKKFISMSVGECLDRIEKLQHELDMWEEM